MTVIINRPDNVFRARDDVASEYVGCVHCHGSGREGSLVYASVSALCYIWNSWACCICGGRGAFKHSS